MLKWDKCLQFALTAFVAAVAAFASSLRTQQPGVAVNWQTQALQVVSASLLCAAVMLFMLAVVRHPWRAKRKAGREKAAKEDRARQEEGERREAERLLAVDRRIKLKLSLEPWERFLPAAMDLRSFLIQIRNATPVVGMQPWPDFGGAPTWQAAIEVKLSAARTLAAALLPAARRDEALRQLETIAEGVASNTHSRQLSGLLHGLVSHFEKWLQDTRAHYDKEKRDAGIK